MNRISLRMTVTFAGAAGCLMVAACASALAQRPPVIDAIDRDFAARAAATQFSGVVLIARGDDILLEQGYGFADHENRSPMAANAILRLGSLTKPITASAILVAVREGRLALSDRICDSLPTCPASWRAVTIRHLLSHTSGIRDHFGDLAAVPVEATGAEVARVLGGLADEALVSEPGVGYTYSNFNYILLGIALERAYGEPWESVLRRTVLAPTGANDIAYDDVWTITPRRAHGYDRRDDGSLRNIEYDDHAAYAAGGLSTTARDLFLWSRGVFSGRLFGEALLREALTPVQDRYGYGWQMVRRFGRDAQNHNGGIDGFSTHIVHYAADDITIIVLSNIESDAAILAACDVAAAWFRIRGAAEGAALQPAERCPREIA
jgi:CubicO group peptidase (beta-lactamase class C family)